MLCLRFPASRRLCIAAFFWFAWRLPDGSGYLSDFRMVIFRRFPHADVPLPVGLYRGFCRFSYCDVPASPVWLYCDLCRFSYCDVPAFRRVVFCFFRQRTVPFVRAALFTGGCPVFLLLKGWVRLFFLFLRAFARFLLLQVRMYLFFFFAWTLRMCPVFFFSDAVCVLFLFFACGPEKGRFFFVFIRGKGRRKQGKTRRGARRKFLP